MKRHVLACVTALIVLTVAAYSTRAIAQAPAQPRSVSNSTPALRASALRTAALSHSQDFSGVITWPRAIQRLWMDYTLAAGDTVRHVFLFAGNAVLEGRVNREVIVALGNVRLGPTAVIGDSLVVIGGNVTVAEGATVYRDLIVIGGVVDAPNTFVPGGEHFVVGSPRLGDQLRELLRWVVWGLLWGRIIVFSIEWIWWVLAVVFVFSLVINIVFQQPVRAAAEVVVTRPLNALLMGALLFVITGPLIVLLGASIIGLLVVPFAICAVFLAWSIGKVGVTRAIGMSLLGDHDPDSRFQSTVAFLLGFVVIVLLYAVPVLGFVAWALVGLFGLGAAGLSFASRLRREYPSRVRAKKGAAPPATGGSAPPDASPMDAPVMAAAAMDPMLASPDAPPAAPVYQPRAPRAEPSPIAIGAALLPHAAFLDRAAAFAIDVILVAITTQFLSEARFLGIHGDMVPLMLLIYHMAFWSWKGTTLGGIICRLRVVRTNGAPLRPIDAVVRGLTSVLSLAAVGIGCLWMLQDANRQTWHDKAAGTFVLKVPKDWALD
jgi:uncharacterized RDD family membrane protein YckC